MTQETLFAGMIFVVVLLMTQAFVAPVMGSRQAARKRLRQRIRNLATTSDGSTHAALVRQKYLQSLSPLERKLESLPHVERLAAIVSQAGMNFPAHRLLILGALLGLTAGAALYVRTDSLVAGLLAATVAAAAPVMYVNRKRMKRLRDFEERLPEALSVIARSLKAGLPFSESIKMVSTEMEGPVSDEFRRLFAELNYGGDVRSALFGLLERVPSVSVMAVVTAVLIERETGGNLADVLDRIGNLIRQRFRFQRSVRTLTSEGRSTAWIASVAPFAVAMILELFKPGWVTGFAADPLGKQLFIGAFVLMVIGILWLKKLVNIDV